MLPALLAALFATLASAEAWQASAEAYFMTRDERREWEQVQTDDEARRFIEAFRARRGADFVAEVQRRVAVVDERLALGEARASTTLRGKIVVLLGAPAEIRLRPIPTATTGNTNTALGTRKGTAGGDSPPKPSMIGSGAGWVETTFRYAENPALGIGPKGWVVVTESNAASGKDRLKYPRRKKELEAILEKAARRSIRDAPAAR